jgi:formyl-CoA transferase
MRVGIPVADLCAGLLCSQGIMIALLEREVSGQGQWVQTSLLQAQVFMLDFQASRWTMSGEIAPQAGNDHPTSIPTGVFQTSDGHINIAAAGQHIFERLSHAMGKPEWIDEPAYKDGETRSENRHRLNAEIAEVAKHDSSANWVEKLNAAGVPTGPINNIKQTFEDPQVRHLAMAETVESPALGPITLVAQGIKLSRTASRIAEAPPERGEHTDEILGGLGYSADELADFRARQVI